MANENKMEFVILGLLSHTPMSGYDLKKRMDTTMSLFWSGSYGSIYPTLQKLSDHGYIVKNDSAEKGREKITYSITEDGREHLKQWLRKPVVKDELRYETMLKLFFGDEIGKPDTLKHIQAFQKKIEGVLPMLKASITELQNLSEESTHEYYMLTAMYGVKIYEASLEWCETVKNYWNNDNKNALE